MNLEAEKLRSYYRKLFHDGYLASLHVTKWSPSRALERRDLKLEKVHSLISLGKKFLIAPKYLSEINGVEAKARQLIYNNSFKFPIAEAHFIPRKKLVDVMTALEKYSNNFNLAVERFIENFPQAQKEALTIYAESLGFDSDEYRTLLTMYPNTERDINDLRNDFSFSTKLFELSMPEALSSVESKTALAVESAYSAAEEEAKDRLESYLAAQYKQSANQIEEFIQGVSGVLKSHILEMCLVARKKISNGEVITKASTDKLKADIEQFRALNFVNNTMLNAELDQLQQLLDYGHDFKTEEMALLELDDVLLQLSLKTSDSQDAFNAQENYLIPINV